MKSQKKSERIKEVLKEFNEKNVRYALMRNYNDFELEKTSDVDVIIDINDIKTVKNILGRYGFLHSFSDWFPFDRMSKTFHIQVQKTSTSRFEKIDVLENRRKEDFFYVLGKEEELKNHILQGLATKGYFKQRYEDRITELMEDEECDKEKVRKHMLDIFGETGGKVFELVKEEEFEEALEHHEEIRRKVYSLKNKIICKLYRIRYPLL